MSISFPASPTVGQTSTQNGRIYTWSGYVWKSAAVSGGSSSYTLPNATSSTLGGVVVGTGLSVSSGTVSANVVSVAGRTGTVTISSSDVSGLSAVATSGSYADLSSKPSIPAATTSASDLTSGTLADARLSGNVILAANLAGSLHQTQSVLEPTARHNVTITGGGVSGAIYWTFFTPPYSLTISQISYASSSAASGVTLCRFGLYTMDSSGGGTLVARTASDTTLFTAGSTVYTRSLDTTGGYPSSYSLVAGTRYAVAVIVVATSVGSLMAARCYSFLSAVSPRIQGARTGNSDLVTTQSSGQYNGNVDTIIWSRLS